MKDDMIYVVENDDVIRDEIHTVLELRNIHYI